MIHLLEIHPGLSLKEVKKLSRRYAMTGGYELTLKADLNSIELQQLVELYLVELKSYQRVNSEYRSSNAYRILKLVFEHPQADSSVRSTLQSFI